MRLHAELVGPMQDNTADHFISRQNLDAPNDGALLSTEEPDYPGFGGCLKHYFLFKGRDVRTSFSGEANQ